MNFMSNLMDSIPVVGHVKGVVHYAVGDKEGGNQAMYQASRSTAVMAGGAAGCIAGPGGAIAGAIAAGAATDTFVSLVNDEPQGVIRGVGDIAEDIDNGRNPIGSIASMGLQVTIDGVGGYGMSGLTGSVATASEKAVANNVAKKMATNFGGEVIEKSVQLTAEEAAKITSKKFAEQTLKKGTEQVLKKGTEQVAEGVILVSSNVWLNAAHRTGKEEQEQRKKEKQEREERERHERAERERRERERRERAERERREREERERRERAERERRERAERERRASGQKNTSFSGTTSGPPPPQPPPQGNKDGSKEASEPDFFKIFIQLLRTLLNVIYGNQKEPFSRIFEKLSQEQKDYLANIIEIIFKNGMLEAVVELMIKIFKDHMPDDISFGNILSLLEFVQNYIKEELAARISVSRGSETGKPKLKPKQRRAIIIQEILKESGIVEKIVHLFDKLRAEIEAETSGVKKLSPDFRDIFAAVYHYFKHRRVPGHENILTVKEYYDWIRKLLQKLKTEHETDYDKLKSPAVKSIVYQIYVVVFGRRFLIVITVRGRELVLSSAYFVTKEFPEDEEGWFDIKIIFKKKFW